eukprot:TRINITY_DN41736_c0_g4_i1.p1 TRINITY_DN41736_c0_g4~~TRINITY_DN41736_c0_g4_i1.p1  ORF type:complete len:628 (-),score=125.07 TRINITY_DN41736_c0_g4_i1:78-1961(-)
MAYTGTDGPQAPSAEDGESKEEQSLIGRRVRVAGNLATVRWGPGPVQAPPSKRPDADAAAEPSTVIVLGIEYDEPGLGKHDGTHQGVRLFECENGKGSFVKVDKAEFGVSFQRALAEKYFASMLGDAAAKGRKTETVDAVEFTDSKGREKEMNVELVGRYSIEQRQQRLEAFVEMALAQTTVSTRYPDNVWEGDWSLPNLKSLWLDRSLVGEWSDIVAICELCPKLEWLSLVKARLAPLPDDVLTGGASLPSPQGMPVLTHGKLLLASAPSVCQIRTLVLSATQVRWKDLLAVDRLNLSPCLEHLHLAQNNLSEGIPAASEVEKAPFPHLQSLILDGNGISDWSIVSRAVAMFPNLQALHLNNNNLGESLEGLQELGADQTPRRLTSLFLNENKLADWKAIAALSEYVLLELKVQRNPVTEGSSPVASPQLLRQVIIALMPTLLRLNSSEIPAKERTASERYLVGIAQQPDNQVIQGLSAGCKVQKHIERLVELHGQVVGGDVSEQAQATRSALVNALVQVTLRPIGAAILDQPQVSKKLPHTMTVAELKRLCQTTFKQVPLARIRLLLADPALPFGVPFDDEGRELGFYGVCDGAEIRVDDTADQKGDRDVARVEGLAGKLQEAEI